MAFLAWQMKAHGMECLTMFLMLLLNIAHVIIKLQIGILTWGKRSKDVEVRANQLLSAVQCCFPFKITGFL